MATFASHPAGNVIAWHEVENSRRLGRTTEREAEMIVNGRRLQLVMPSVTLEDVANAAGVSKSTASRALCNEPNVKRETRERVLSISNRLGYVPNEAARALAACRAVVIGAARAV